MNRNRTRPSLPLFLLLLAVWQWTIATAVFIRPFPDNNPLPGQQQKKNGPPTTTRGGDNANDNGSAGSIAAATAGTFGTLLQQNRDLVTKGLNIVVAGVLGFAFDPWMEQLFNATHLKNIRGDYKKTFLYGAADSVEMGARAYGLLMIGSLVQDFMPPSLRDALPFKIDLDKAAPDVGFTVWLVRAVSTTKHMMLNKFVMGHRLGKVHLLDRLIDFSLGILTIYNILHQLHVDIGRGLSSLFAASGVSAIIFSLASKGMIEQMVNGLFLQAWDAVEEGEYVQLGDGTEGTIMHIGLLETEVLGPDHVPIRVPNSQIIGKRVTLYGKVTQSQVKQILRFKYQDLEKLPLMLQDIKLQIETSCQKMNRPPQVALTQYEADHIQVMVNCHFDVKPGTDEYVETREKVLFAIADAVKKHRVEFALPAILYETQHPRSILA